MTVSELRKLLEPFDGKQEVFIDLYSMIFPDGCHVIIQMVKEVPPWKDGLPNLIGLVAHASNAEVKT